MKRTTLMAALVVLVLSLSTVPAFAGGDQVHRPDESGTFYHDGLQAEGESPFSEFEFELNK